MKILVIDGMGGGMGKAIIEQIRNNFSEHEITAVGTNSTATAAMLKAGANHGATGENAVIYNCRNTDLILGAIGIVFANSMYGEISPAIAGAISSSDAYKILVPISKCSATVLGVTDKPLQSYLEEITSKIKSYKIDN